MSRLLTLFALLLGAPLLAAAQPLVTPAELSARLAEPRRQFGGRDQRLRGREQGGAEQQREQGEQA